VCRKNCFDGFFLTGVSKTDPILLVNPQVPKFGCPRCLL
jgi:hypothetical protein